MFATSQELIGFLGSKRLSFYHFTDARNLPSISELGLLSMEQLEKRGIRPVAGGNQWSLDADKIAGMHRYVHLCLTMSHPMEWKARNEGRIKDTRFIAVDPRVITLEGVRLVNGVSNKAGIVPKPVDQGLAEIDWEVIYTSMDWRLPEIKERRTRALKCEIIVPDSVSLGFLSI